jgi:YHS domain-containing protein
MTVVKANAKATFDYKGTTYYFCSTGCKEAFAKEPEKYIKAQQAKAEQTQAPAPMGGMQHMHMGQTPMPEGSPMAGRPMMGRGMMMRPGRMGMMPGGIGLGPIFFLHGADVEATVENTKDGAVLKLTSKDPETVKAIQVHMSEHLAMLKKMKERAAQAAAKAPESGSCANCPMKK